MNAHSKIEKIRHQVTVADDGTMTLPANVSECAGWKPGTKLAVIEEPGSIGLWSQSEADASRAAVDEAFERIQQFNPYREPMITDEEVDEIVSAAAVARYQRTL